MIFFSRYIKQLRSQHGLTQEDLARNLKVSVSTIQRWENGNHTAPATKSLIDICNLFHVSLNDLIGIAKENSIDIEALTPGQQELLKTLMIEFYQPTGNQNMMSNRQGKIIQMLLSEFSK